MVVSGIGYSIFSRWTAAKFGGIVLDDSSEVAAERNRLSAKPAHVFVNLLLLLCCIWLSFLSNVPRQHGHGETGIQAC